MNNKRMLVIGSGGQLGTDMCNEAAIAGYTVTGIDFPTIDIADRKSVEGWIASTEASVVVNCAAFTAVDNCETEQERAFLLNADGAGYIAEACEQTGARMVHISTDYVFSGDKIGPYIESDTPNPKSVYGRSKLAGEERVAAACSNHQIFRIAWLYGLHGKNFLFTIRSAAEKMATGSGTIKVVNDQYGTPTTTIEVCRQILAAQESELTGIFHATCEGSCTWFDFASAVIKAAAIPVTVLPCTTEEFPRPAPRPKNSILENSRLKAAGINIMHSWEDALKTFLKSEKQ